MDGTSFLYSFDDANAAERHTVQYFEIVGNRAIYKDGWWAACKLDRIPWDLSPPTMARFAPGAYDPEQDTWELYYLPDDFTQANDLADEAPREARRTQGALLGGGREAQRAAAAGGVLGLLRDPAADADDHDTDVLRRRPEHRLRDDPARLRPLLRDRGGAHRCPSDGAEGVIVAEADEMGGFSLWVDENGLLHHSYSMMGVEQYKQVSTEPIPTGDVTVRMQFDADRQERSAGGTVSLYANDAKIGEGRMERTVAVRFSGYAGMDIGRDNGLVGRPRLRGQGPVRVHRHGEEGRLRPQAGGQARGREDAARGRHPRSPTAHGISA